MKILKNLKFVAVFALLFAFAAAANVTSTSYAQQLNKEQLKEKKTNEKTTEKKEQAKPEEAKPQENKKEDKSKEEKTQKPEGKSKNTTTATFKYIAQPGDSYSVIARKAIQTFGKNNAVKLSKAQIIFAETMLTQAANSPLLSEGQNVEIKEADVSNWAEKAQKLSKDDEAAWEKYTIGVNFNTDAVGEART